MKIAYIAAMVIALMGCAGQPSNAASNDAQAHADALRAQVMAGQMTWLERSRMMRDYAARTGGANPEFWTYHAMTWAEVDAGRMSQLQAEYLITQKNSQLNNAALMNALGAAAIYQATQPAPQPYRSFRQPPATIPPSREPTFTNCEPRYGGGFTCTTR